MNSQNQNNNEKIISQKIKILCVEDDLKDIDLLIDRLDLEENQFEVQHAFNGKKFLEYLDKGKYDLLLLDYNLPDYTGLELLSEINERKISLPVIMLTGMGNEDLVIKSLRGGAIDYIPKHGNYLVNLPQILKQAILEHKKKNLRSSLLKQENYNILYVEDSKEDIELLQSYFKRNAPNYFLIPVEKSIDAINILQSRNDISLVLCDVKLPDLNALDLFREIKIYGIDLPFIFITAYGGEENAIASLRLGVYDYIIKRNNYEKQVPVAIENAIIRFQLEKFKEKLIKDLAEANKKLSLKVIEKESEIKKIEIDYQSLINNAKDAIFTIGFDKSIKSINPAFEILTEWKVEDWLDKEFDQLIHQEDLPLASNNFLRVLKGETVPTFELRILNKDNSFQFFEFLVFPHYADDKIIGVQGIARDIKERKEAEKKEKDFKEYLKCIIESSMDMIITVDNERKIVEFNLAAEKTFGYTREEVCGKHINFLYADQTEGTRIFQTVFKEGTVYGEIFNKRKNGEVFPCLISASIMKNEKGKVIGGVGVSKDITEFKKVHQELIEAKEKAEEMNRLKTSFLNNMSHELRTPLIGILGFTEVLNSELQNEDQKAMVQAILNSGKRLSHTLNLILDLSRIEAGKIPYQLLEYNIADEVKTIAEIFKGAALKKQIDFEVVITDKDVCSKLDDRMFIQIIENLIDNAIKFTKAGKVTVEVDSVYQNINEQEQHFAQIKITDTGIGIPQNSLQNIFDEFRQVSEGLSRAYEGTGLGLSITKKFIDKMKGKISVKSKLGNGSVFTVLFPSYYSSKKETTDSKNTIEKIIEIPVSNKEFLPDILLIDDDEIAVTVTIAYLKNICKIDSVANEEDALEKCQSKKYSAILLDINLGLGISGLEILKKIKQIQGVNDLPIVAFTAYAMVGDKEKFLKAGCTHYISKPFLRKELIELMNEVLKRK